MSMFKMLTAAVLMVIAANGVTKAQTEGLTFGVKAGANYANLPSGLKDLKEETGKMGFSAGAFARIGYQVFFQPEINFVHFSGEFEHQGRKFDPKFNQLNLPLMVGYKVIDTENLNFRLSIGPDLNYNLSEPSQLKDFDFKKFNLGGVFNAGVDLGSITIDARYSRGFTDLNKGFEQKAGIYTLSVGFKVL
ncbi:MAG TPA: porin family protein [Pseudosphingobacterium sp.]|nr:porin family protein [Pseudosphingobacterium sp.]